MYIVIKEISKEEVLKVTNNFNDGNLIGEGGFAKVYKVMNFRSPGTTIAIKHFNEVWHNIIILYKCI